MHNLKIAYFFQYIFHDPTFVVIVDECKVSQRGIEYRGTLSKTKSGYSCWAWSSPWQHNYPEAGLVNNYCRNPDTDPKGPWCFTNANTTQWEHCNVSLCGKCTTCFDYF